MNSLLLVSRKECGSNRLCVFTGQQLTLLRDCCPQVRSLMFLLDNCEPLKRERDLFRLGVSPVRSGTVLLYRRKLRHKTMTVNATQVTKDVLVAGRHMNQASAQESLVVGNLIKLKLAVVKADPTPVADDFVPSSLGQPSIIHCVTADSGHVGLSQTIVQVQDQRNEGLGRNVC